MSPDQERHAAEMRTRNGKGSIELVPDSNHHTVGITLSRENSAPSTIGAIAELIAAADLMNRGFDVFRTLSPCSPCDLIVTRGEETIRIEVKCTDWKEGNIIRRSRNKGGCADTVALVLKSGGVVYRPPLPERKAEEAV